MMTGSPRTNLEYNRILRANRQSPMFSMGACPACNTVFPKNEEELEFIFTSYRNEKLTEVDHWYCINDECNMNLAATYTCEELVWFTNTKEFEESSSKTSNYKQDLYADIMICCGKDFIDCKCEDSLTFSQATDVLNKSWVILEDFYYLDNIEKEDCRSCSFYATGACDLLGIELMDFVTKGKEPLGAVYPCDEYCYDSSWGGEKGNLTEIIKIKYNLKGFSNGG